MCQTKGKYNFTCQIKGQIQFLLNKGQIQFDKGENTI